MTINGDQPFYMYSPNCSKNTTKCHLIQSWLEHGMQNMFITKLIKSARNLLTKRL